MTKKILLTICMLGLLALSGCKKDDGKMDCTVYWQLFRTTKYVTDDDIEAAYRETFFGFWSKVNDNTVIARSVTKDDVRSLTLKLCSMADAKITETRDPQDSAYVEMRVYIDYAGDYTEEVWGKNY